MTNTTTENKLDISMITDIIEDGKNLRSINELMARYDVKFPFTAYNHKYGTNVLLTGIVSPNETHKHSCGCVVVNKYVGTAATSSPCGACILGEDYGTWWDLNFKNWTLSGY
jgi:hypothetical protein